MGRDGFLDWRFSLDIGFSTVEACDENEENRGKEHQQSEESKVGRVFEIDSEIAESRNQKIQDRRKLVAQGDRKKPGRHNDAFHLFRRLSVRKFQAGDRNHHFTRSQQDIGQKLPDDTRPGARIDAHLNPPNHQERRRNQEEADPDLSQGREGKDTMDGGIDQIVENRDQDENEKWVCHLDLLWQKL